jgi:Cu(I)/Ag(I) efflux system membrane protein CusA/SilA
MKGINSLGLAAILAMTCLPAAYADERHAAMPQAASAASAKTNAMTDGEITKVDKATGRLVIRHGEIKNLAMPAMTMPFLVKDKAMLDHVKAGDKIWFAVAKINGRLTVTQIKPMPGR